MTIQLLALVLCPLLPQAPSEDGAPPSLVPLPIPALCAVASAPPVLPRLLDGRHVRLPGRSARDAATGQGTEFTLLALASLLQEDAARGRRSLRIQAGGPPLLVRGEDAAVESARAALGGLDRAGRAFDVELAVWLTPGAAKLGVKPASEVFEAAVANVAPIGRARVRSGGSVVFGTRRRSEFVATYDVQIASGSSIAGPKLGEVLHGRTLHLRASRVGSGRGVALEGLLDLAEPLEMRTFETGTPELGDLEQPVVAAVQVGFSGIVGSGQVLSVSISGSGLSAPDWTLWIQSTTAEDPSDPGSWRARDVAWLEDVARTWPVPGPGAGFDEFENLAATEGPTYGFGAAALAQAADSMRGRGGRVPIVWSPGLLLAPADETALWQELDSLITKAEAERFQTYEMRLEHGDLSVTFPVIQGLPVRVLAGRERAQLTGYALEVSTDTWIPRPEVEIAFDGVLFQGSFANQELVGHAWRAHSGPPRALERDVIGLARLEPRERTLATASVRARTDAVGGNALEADASSPALRLSLQRR